MVSVVRHVQRAHDFLGLLDISWTRVALGKTFLSEAHAFVEAYVSPFAFRLHLQSLERDAQACILGPAIRKQRSFPVNLHLLQLGFLSGSSFRVARLLEEQCLNMWVLQGRG